MPSITGGDQLGEDYAPHLYDKNHVFRGWDWAEKQMKKPNKIVKPKKPIKPKKPVKAIILDRTDIKISEVMNGVENEIRRAVELHGPMKSFHEGYAVILEEMDELWDQVKLRASKRDLENIREEAIQIAAMACRLVVDLL